MKKVSIIIPFYNQNLYLLKQAVDSVINQTLNDIEVICIDDGSVNSVCSDFLSNYNEKIKVLKTEHKGSGNARNKGINESNSENIMFLDSDDYYPDNTVLEKLYTLKNKEHVQIAGGKHLILNENNFEEPYFNYGNINDYFCNRTVDYNEYQFPWWYWCFMFDSNLIKINKIYFPPYLRYQDPPFFVRVMHKAKYFYAADFVSYIHRNSNKLFSLTPKQAFDHVKGIQDLLLYSKQNNLLKLHSLLYNTFYSFDLNIINNIKDLTVSQKEELINLIEPIKL